MANAYKTNYFDPMGKSHTGYIIDGKTYKDPQGTKRVEQGSVVETADGYYTLTSSGGVKTDFKNKQIENTKSEIEGLKNNIKNQHEASYRSQKAQIDAKKRGFQTEFNRKARNEYLKAMESEKNMDQLLKLQGLTGGMTESRKLQNKLAYENSINALREQLSEGLSDLDNELLKLRNETDYNIAEDMAEYDNLYLSYLTKYQDNYSDWLRDAADRNADSFKNIYLSEKEDERFREEMDFDKEKFREEMEFDKGKFQEEMNFDKEKFQEQMNFDKEKFQEQMNFDKEKFKEEMELDKEKFAQDVMEDNRSYNLSAAKVSKSNSDTAYKRRMEEAEIRAKFGDFTLMAEIFGWDEETLKKAMEDYKKKGH